MSAFKRFFARLRETLADAFPVHASSAGLTAVDEVYEQQMRDESEKRRRKTQAAARKAKRQIASRSGPPRPRPKP
jgi:polyhydroxyalkanoate synthesis regulator protein